MLFDNVQGVGCPRPCNVNVKRSCKFITKKNDCPDMQSSIAPQFYHRNIFTNCHMCIFLINKIVFQPQCTDPVRTFKFSPTCINPNFRAKALHCVTCISYVIYCELVTLKAGTASAKSSEYRAGQSSPAHTMLDLSTTAKIKLASETCSILRPA